MKLTIDIDGQIAFKNYQQKQEYNRRMNKWYEKHVNRRYVSEYYAARNELKEATVDTLNAAQKEINYLMDRYTQNGIFYTDQMDDTEKARLDSLLKQKENLYSKYYQDGTKKSGTDLEIAEDLIAFRKKLQGKLKYKSDWGKYLSMQKLMLQKYGKDSAKYKEWYKYNTEVVFT
jgi:hypothetical protein